MKAIEIDQIIKENNGHDKPAKDHLIFGIVPDWPSCNDDGEKIASINGPRYPRLGQTKEKMIYDKLRREFWN